MLFTSPIENVSAQPNFQDDFAGHLLDAQPDAQGRVETVFDWGIDTEKSLIENVRTLFYPDAAGKGGKIYDLLRPIIFAVFVLFLVLTGVFAIMNAGDGNKVRGSLKSILYIILGAGIFFAATWVLGVALNLDANLGSEGLVQNLQNNLMFQIFAFLRAAAFFAAIVMMIWYGYQIMNALDEEDKFKKGRQGVFNIIMALVLIKVIDFLYFIAQEQDFQTRATEAIVTTARVLGYLLGAAFMVYVLYGGAMLILGRGKPESLNKIKGVLTAIFLGSIVIFMFLLIIYQVVQEFGLS